MKLTKQLYTIIILAVSISLTASAQQSITHSTFSSGAGIMAENDSNTSIRGTLGQTIIGVTANSSYVNRIGFYYRVSDIVTVVEPLVETSPLKFQLDQNYPNPFNPQTTIQFSLPEALDVRLTIYDLMGREIAVLEDKKLAAGNYRVIFNASELPSGVYLYQIKAGHFIRTKRLLLLK